jgi:hypothetical protein
VGSEGCQGEHGEEDYVNTEEDRMNDDNMKKVWG